ncbi:MAG: DUF1997 domain-containing protein [Leptolyngbya sp. SIO1E4]|nr:DUF1997 domain-containing protein [Leptolyngbya sp. SIO1E4]
MLRLSARQSVTMQVSQKSVPLHHYLKQPQRLVHALMNPSQVEDLGSGHFRLRLRVIRFLMLNICPVVDLHIDVSQARFLKVRSVACQIQGNEFVDQRFDLSLSGFLKLEEQAKTTRVSGQVNLAIAVDLPPIMQLTPYAILETTGNQILKGILATMKQRLIRQLAADYDRWSAQQTLQKTPKLAMGGGTSQASCLDS